MKKSELEERNFIQKIIDNDNQTGKWGKRVHTRFPPEPNGYLHIGHAKSICLNFGIAEQNNGRCNLRFDDTNPIKEEVEYVKAIIDDIKWLGFKWGKKPLYASDYFKQMHEYAVQLILKGKAFVCDQSSEEIKKCRGTLSDPGVESPFRNRDINENLDLFKRMRNGDFPNGSKTLRAKIDMSHSNLNMRDPVMYRILNVPHHRTGNAWCIYPMYDWAHGIEDSIEKITHSICTLEFEDHRPLYDWYLKELGVYHPQQIEFSRLNLNFTVMSKRKLKLLVDEKFVEGWDDPRMPTISGLRKRGYTSKSIRKFAESVGVTKRDSVIDVVRLENALRDELNKKAQRVFCILNPVKVVITNYDRQEQEYLKAVNNPEDPDAGSREIPFSNEIYIDRDDFMENPPKKFFRLSLGSEVRLKYAYFIKCNEIIKDSNGHLTEIRCTYDPETKGGKAPDGRKVRGTIHWVCVKNSIKVKVKLYDRLFSVEHPDQEKNFLDAINPNSLQVIDNARLEPSLTKPKYINYQFERIGYFKLEEEKMNPDSLIFIRSVSLRDSWARFLKQNDKK